jgi:opacity protein-like surface antigen
MEDHLQPDKLDDFVRKSFENYEENPSEDRWNKIAAALEQPKVLPLASQKNGFEWKSYLSAAAIVLLSIGMVTEYFYFSNKINELTKIATKSNELKVENIELPSNQSFKIKQNDANVAIEDGKRKDIFQKNVFSQPSSSNNSQILIGNFANSQILKDGQIKDIFQKNNFSNQQPTQFEQESDKVAINQFLNTQSPTTNNEVDQIHSVNSQSLNLSLDGINKVVDVEQLPLVTLNSFKKIKEISFLTKNTIPKFIQKQENSLQIASVILKPVKNPSNWYLSVTMNRRVEQELKDDFRGRGPNNHPDVRSSKDSKYTQDFALNIGKKTNRHVGFETGLIYNNSLSVSSHSPNFKKRDGRRHGGGGHGGPGGPGGGHDQDLDFEYKLHTYSGVATVNLRMTQADTTAQVDDDEPLNLKVTTKEKVQILRIPLLATYTFGKGRLLLNSKIGVNASFFLKNNLEITGLDAQNMVFKPEQDYKPMTSFQSPSKVKMALAASVGLEYRLTKRWSILAEPNFVRDFESQSEIHKLQPNHLSFGLNTGVKMRI